MEQFYDLKQERIFVKKWLADDNTDLVRNHRLIKSCILAYNDVDLARLSNEVLELRNANNITEVNYNRTLNTLYFITLNNIDSHQYHVFSRLAKEVFKTNNES